MIPVNKRGLLMGDPDAVDLFAHRVAWVPTAVATKMGRGISNDELRCWI